MIVGSLFSGVGGMDLGLERAGFEHAFFCEADEWRRKIIAHHWPGVPVYHDVRDVARDDLGQGEEGDESGRLREMGGVGHRPDVQQDDARLDTRIDLLCGGFPCQDVSVAGKRAGLAGERSGLFFEFARIADTLRPGFLLIENVFGLFSSHGGRDFGVVLETLAECGYGVAWRTFDSQHFGVPQRRRRVFILACLDPADPRGAAERAGEVLAVGASCERHSQKGQQAEPDIAGTLGARTGAGRGGGTRTTDLDGHGVYVTDHYYVEDHEDGTLRSNGTGGSRTDRQPIVFNMFPTKGTGTGLQARETDTAASVTALPPTRTDRGVYVAGSGVRRLTPIECERLQSWPDDFTNPTGKEPDSRRYAAIGDGVTANVTEWIGRRLILKGERSG